MVVAIFFLVAICAIGVAAIKAARMRAAPEELDLDPVRDALIEKQGWSRERAEAARAEYIRFLTLLQMRPGFMLVPWATPEGQDDLDQFWHQHILDTAKYAADCNRLFGRMIHHNPHLVRGSEDERTAVEKTQRLYARRFGSGVYGQPADAIMVSSCASCATWGSSGEAGHGGHGGHGDGGHGGDHSCGGHGCGHGCGGH